MLCLRDDGDLVTVRSCSIDQVKILGSLKHPNVVEIYQFFKDDPSTYYMVIEYVQGGELFDRIVKKVSPLFLFATVFELSLLSRSPREDPWCALARRLDPCELRAICRELSNDNLRES